MEHTSHTPQTTDRPWRVPPLAWIVGLGLMAALAAVFVFNVAVSTVAYYGFIGLMFGGHFFMHGSHGGHAGHTGHGPRTINVDGSADTTPAKDEHAGHSGGCH